MRPVLKEVGLFFYNLNMKKILVILCIILFLTSCSSVNVEPLGIPTDYNSYYQRLIWLSNNNSDIKLPHINNPLGYPYRGGASIVLLRVTM